MKCGCYGIVCKGHEGEWEGVQITREMQIDAIDPGGKFAEEMDKEIVRILMKPLDPNKVFEPGKEERVFFGSKVEMVGIDESSEGLVRLPGSDEMTSLHRGDCVGNHRGACENKLLEAHPFGYGTLLCPHGSNVCNCQAPPDPPPTPTVTATENPKKYQEILKTKFEDDLMVDINKWSDKKADYIYAILYRLGHRVDKANATVQDAKFEEVDFGREVHIV